MSDDKKIVKVTPVPAEDAEVPDDNNNNNPAPKKKVGGYGGSAAPLSKDNKLTNNNEEDAMIKEQVELLCRRCCYPSSTSAANKLDEESTIATALSSIGEMLRNPAYFSDSSSVVTKKDEPALASTAKAGSGVGSVPKPLKHIRAYFMLIEEQGLIAGLRRSPVFGPYLSASGPNELLKRDEVQRYVLACCTDAETSSITSLKEGSWEHLNEQNRRAFHDLLSFIAMTIQFHPLTAQERDEMAIVKDRLYRTQNATSAVAEEETVDVEESAKKQAELKKLTIRHESLFFPTISYLFSDGELDTNNEDEETAAAAAAAALEAEARKEAADKAAGVEGSKNESKAKKEPEPPARPVIRVSLYHKLCGCNIRTLAAAAATGFGLWYDSKTTAWGHEYLRTLAGEISTEWHFLAAQKDRLEDDGATLPAVVGGADDNVVSDEQMDIQYIAAFQLAIKHQRFYTKDPAAVAQYTDTTAADAAPAGSKAGPQGFAKVSYLNVDSQKTPAVLPSAVNKSLRQLQVSAAVAAQSGSPLLAIKATKAVLVKIVSSILYFTLVQNHDESTSVDLAIEIGKPELLLDYCHSYFTTPHKAVDADTSKHHNNFDRVAQYLLACAQYLPLTSERNNAIYVAYRLYRRHMMFIPAARALLLLLPSITPSSPEAVEIIAAEDGDELEEDMDTESKNNTIYLPLASLFRMMLQIDFYYFLFAKAHEASGSFNHKEAVQHAGFFTLSSASTLTRDSMLQIALVCARQSIFLDFSQMLSGHFLPPSQLALFAKRVVSFVQSSCPQGGSLSDAMLPLFNGIPSDAVKEVAGAYRESIADPLINEVLQPENSNSRRSEYYRHAAAELDSLAPKHPEEEVFKTKNKAEADAATIDSGSYMHNLSLAFVNGLVNCGYGTDKIIAAESTAAASGNNVSLFYKTKDHRRLTSAASLGLIHLWGLSSTSAAGGSSAEGAVDEVKDGLSVVDQYTYSEDPFIQAGAALATGILCCNTASPFDPALSLLSDKVTPSSDGTTETNHYVRIASILGLGLAYAGQNRQDVKELLIPLIIENSFSGNNSNVAMKSNCFEIQAFSAIALSMVFAGSRDDDISEAIVTCLLEHGDDGPNDAENDEEDANAPSNNLFLVSHPATVYLILALGSLFLGSREGGSGLDINKKRHQAGVNAPGAVEPESDEEEEGNNLEVLLEATKALSPGIQLFTEITITACAYAGSGNVLQIQRMFNLILEDEDDDDDETTATPAAGAAETEDAAAKKAASSKKVILNYKSAAVLAIGMIAMGTEEISVEMAKRCLIHILLADHVSKGPEAETEGAAAASSAPASTTPFMSGRSAVPLAYSLLSLSTPSMPVVETLHKLSHDNFFATSAGASSRRGAAAAANVSTTAMNAILGMGLVSAGSNNARVSAMLRSLASYYGSASQSSTAANNNSLLWMVRISQGLTAMGKGHAYLSPVHTDRSLISPSGLVGILAVMFSCLDVFDSSAAGGNTGFLSILSASASGSGPIRTLLDRYHFMLYMIVPAIAPRALVTVSASTDHGKTLSAADNTTGKTTSKADAAIDGAAAAPSAHTFFNESQHVSYVNCQARTGTPLDSVTIPGKKPKRITGFTTNNTPTLMLPTEERAEIVSNYAHYQKPQSSGMAQSSSSSKKAATTSKVLSNVADTKEAKAVATTGYRALPGAAVEGVVVVEKLFYKQILYEEEDE